MTLDSPCNIRKNAGVRRNEKPDLKIDMTPMVDLGFLLIAFFVLTTEISKPTIIKLYMPHDGTPTQLPESKSLTILLGARDQVFYYFGTQEKAIKSRNIFQTDYDEMNGLGRMIRKKQTALETGHISKRELIIIIKPTKEALYKNLLAALDELLIDGVTKYTIADPQNEEVEVIKGLN